MKIPINFDGAKFAKKHGLGINDFWVDKGVLICPSIPNIKEVDISDCIVEPPTIIELRQKEYDKMGLSRDKMIDALWEKIMHLNSENADAIEVERAKINNRLNQKRGGLNE